MPAPAPAGAAPPTTSFVWPVHVWARPSPWPSTRVCRDRGRHAACLCAETAGSGEPHDLGGALREAVVELVVAHGQVDAVVEALPQAAAAEVVRAQQLR